MKFNLIEKKNELKYSYRNYSYNSSEPNIDRAIEQAKKFILELNHDFLFYSFEYNLVQLKVLNNQSYNVYL